MTSTVRRASKSPSAWSRVKRKPGHESVDPSLRIRTAVAAGGDSNGAVGVGRERASPIAYDSGRVRSRSAPFSTARSSLTIRSRTSSHEQISSQSTGWIAP